ncbi:MAG: cobalamin-binding protein [Planctomycetota bacterium]
MRIVSLLPSATEILCGIGLQDSLVGVSHECDHPEAVRSIPTVTQSLIPTNLTSQQIDQHVREQWQASSPHALYRLDRERMIDLAPDLIVTQSVCDVCAVAEDDVRQATQAMSQPPAILNLEPVNASGVLDCIRLVGQATDRDEASSRFAASLEQRIDHIRERNRELAHHPSVVFLEWVDPLFTAGHWTPELIETAGGVEMLGVAGTKSRTIAWEHLVQADPEILVVACCGYDVEQTRRDVPVLANQSGWESLQSVRNGNLFVADGSSYFNRPGPRIVDSIEILAHCFHPELHALPTPLTQAVQRVNVSCI